MGDNQKKPGSLPEIRGEIRASPPKRSNRLLQGSPFDRSQSRGVRFVRSTD